MSATDADPVLPPSLVDRVRGLILRPSQEFERIAVEPATPSGLYRNYLCILAAVAPLASLVHAVVFIRLGIMQSLVTAAAYYAASLAMTYVMALVIEALAPNFGGVKDRLRALKVAVYAPTPAMLAGVFQAAPFIAFFALLGLQSFYLLWVGLPRLMGVAPEKKGGFYAAIIVIMVGLWMLAGFLVFGLIGSALVQASPL